MRDLKVIVDARDYILDLSDGLSTQNNYFLSFNHSSIYFSKDITLQFRNAETPEDRCNLRYTNIKCYSSIAIEIPNATCYTSAPSYAPQTRQMRNYSCPDKIASVAVESLVNDMCLV